MREPRRCHPLFHCVFLPAAALLVLPSCMDVGEHPSSDGPDGGSIDRDSGSDDGDADSSERFDGASDGSLDIHDGGEDVCSVSVHMEATVPRVVLLIDQSASMEEEFGGTTRWNAVRDALVHSERGIVTQLEHRVMFGATLYSSHHGWRDGGTCPELVEAEPVVGNLAALEVLFRDNRPEADTPTAESITAVAEDLRRSDPAGDTPLFIVLATDGEPDRCADSDGHDDISRQMSEEAAALAFALGVPTNILSVGRDIREAHLQRVANAGAGEPVDSGRAPFYIADDPAGLEAAFDEIIYGVRACSFAIDGAVHEAEAATGTVMLNGSPLTYGEEWHLADSETLELLGDACETFLNELEVTLNAEFPCGAMVY